MSPPSEQFAPVKLLPPVATKVNLYAAHLTAAGYRNWGAVWGTSLNWAKDGFAVRSMRRGFAGVKFRAKGPGLIKIQFGMPETVPVEYGGTCKSNCYSLARHAGAARRQVGRLHRAVGSLAARRWGAEARFDPARLLNLNFAVLSKDLPSDFWLDDVKFVTQAEANERAAHAR